MEQVILLSMNEINFHYIQKYNEKNLLPNFKRLIDTNGYSVTTSETEYKKLEPWIQWVTAHTGLDFSEHGVFRLGDIVNHSYDQIWEKLEREKGLNVGAISPFNAKNRLKNPAFFIPDPWTATTVSGSDIDKVFSNAISQAVNDNAKGKITFKSMLALVVGIISNARFVNYKKYISLAMKAKQNNWNKAMFLDLLLFDVFMKKWHKNKPDFSSLFLNAGAHIQHHYMFSSSVYDGNLKNPSWYIDSNEDPLLEVFQLYDDIVAQILDKVPNARLFIATGLTQDPYPKQKFYYRLKDHKSFLEKLGVPFKKVEPRMSRDFLIHCENENDAKVAGNKLLALKSDKGDPVFSVDNRGSTIFVMLEYSKEITKDFKLLNSNGMCDNFYNDTVFVALKNGGHNGNGFFLDSKSKSQNIPKQFALKRLPSIIEECFE